MYNTMDYGFSADHTRSSELTLRVTTSRGEEPSRASHVWVHLGAYQVCEALAGPNRIVIRSVQERMQSLKNADARYAVYRSLSADSGQRLAAARRMHKLNGKHYAHVELPMQLADEEIGRLFYRLHIRGMRWQNPIVVRWLGIILPQTICSGVAGQVGYKGGLMPWTARFWNPDQIHDLVMREHWKLLVEDGSGWFTQG